MPFTLILDDPLANSYLQSLYAPDPDPQLETESYERTYEQNDDLGLNDMITEGYDQPNPLTDMERMKLAEQEREEKAKEGKAAEVPWIDESSVFKADI